MNEIISSKKKLSKVVFIEEKRAKRKEDWMLETRSSLVICMYVNIFRQKKMFFLMLCRL